MPITTRTVTEVKCDLCGEECETSQWEPRGGGFAADDDARGPIPYHTVTLTAFRSRAENPKTKTLIVGLCCQGKPVVSLIKKADSEEGFGWKTY